MGLLLAAVLACGGCASGADYERPRLAAPERFLGESAVQSRQATRPADPASWWRDFDDPLLAGLVEEALAQNLEIAQAIARVTQARAGLRAANAEIGRASCRERVCQYVSISVVAVSLKIKTQAQTDSTPTYTPHRSCKQVQPKHTTLIL